MSVRLEPRALGDGLVLRMARRSDRDELAELNGAVQADVDVPAEEVAEWTLDLFENPPPGFRAEEDVTVVEDTANGRIVSTMCLIPQTWTYAGVQMAVGQPELVGTHSDYRRRGLVRAQFEVIHRRSDLAGHQWQVIGGIPWYYRQFGYVYALDLPPAPVWRVPKDLPATPAGLAVRRATLDDLGFLARIDAAGSGRPGLGCVRDEDTWRYELTQRPGALVAGIVLVIEREGEGGTAPPQPLGFVVHAKRPRAGSVSLWDFGLEVGESWLAPTAAVLAHLAAWVKAHPDGPGDRVKVLLPEGHPARRSAATSLGQDPSGTYGLYVRVSDPRPCSGP